MMRESVRLAISVIVVLIVSYLGSCANTSVQVARAQSAIDAFAEVIKPAYSLAVSACKRAEWDEVAKESDGGQAPEVTDQNLAAQRARCDAITAIFQRMRTALAAAETAIDDGALDQANDYLEEVRDQWAALKSP